MLIGIDASRANKTEKTGVEWYAYHLIEEFKKIDYENRYFLYTNTSLTGALAACPPNFEERLLPWPLPRFWTLGRLSWEMRFGREIPDVLFIPAHTAPFYCPRRTVVTVHDIGFEHYPELYPRADRWYHRFSIRLIKKSASKIITVSNFSKNDLAKICHLPREKISVVYNGYDATKYFPAPASLMSRAEPFILFIGRLEEKKNVCRLVEAFSLFRQRHSQTPYQLFLIGRPGFGFDRLEKMISQHHLEPVVKIFGWVSEDEVPTYFQRAALFVLPSLFEGFGIPVLQAMACGCPVICSQTTSLPEVAGEAALLFNPEKVEEIVSRMEQVLLNPEVQESLQEKGRRQVQNFSWQKCARETWQLLLATVN